MSDAMLDLLTDLIAKAKRAGADAADAVRVEGIALSHSQRLGKIEKLERSEGSDLGLRVLIGKKQAIVSSNDTDPVRLNDLVERAIAMARVVPEDPYCGLADPEQCATSWPDLDLADPIEPATDRLIAWAKAAEEAARAVPGVTNSEGADASWGRHRIWLAGSNGFAGSYSGTSHSISVSVLAGEGSGMERDYDYTAAVYAEDLEAPEIVGRRAGEQAVRRLNPQKPVTQQVPVIYDPRVSASLVGHLVGAITGPAIARKTSFLRDKLGERVMGAGLTIVDDPHRRRGLRSKPFDAEGLANRRTNLVADGVLETWLLDLRSARQLGLKSTGHASRGTSGPPGPSATNLYLEPGPLTPNALMADIAEGLYVTDLIGMGVNGVTGDYSRGASGFWIRNGEITHPVAGITIAGNLKDMFLNLTPANDLRFKMGTNAPTLRIDGMTLAGS